MKWPAINQRHLRISAFVLFAFLFCSQLAIAETSADAAQIGGILDAVDKNYKGLQSNWYSAIKGYAQNLFWILVLIDFGWSAVVYALEKQDFIEVIISLAKKMFPIGFFWSLLKMSDTWIPAIINSFIKIGQAATGQGELSPSQIASDGADLFFSTYSIMRDLNTLEAIAVVFPVTLLALVILAAMIYVAWQMLMANIEMYIVCGGGVILLGFGGSRWTTDFATKYLQYAVSVGIKYLVMYLIVGGGKTLIEKMTISPDNLIPSLVAVLITVVIFAGLVMAIPKLAAGMASGQAQLSAGSAFQAAVTIGAAMAGAGALAAAGTKAAAGAATEGVAGAAGLAKALGAGFSSGADMGKSGIGAAAHAAGEVAKHGLNLGTEALGSALNKASSSFADKVESSTGGQIASSIEATRGGSLSGASPAGGDSSPATSGSSSAPPQSDVAGGQQGAAPASGGSGQGSAAAPGAQPAAKATPAGSSTGGAPSSTASPAPASPAGGGNAPVSGLNGGSGGDASGASISGSSVAPPSSPAGAPYKAPMHERIKSLEGYVPQDEVAIQVGNIQSGHTQD